jgi:DNA-binding NarL/FixJ family response regulator
MRVGLVDDSLLFREGLARLVKELGFDVAFQASTVDALPEQVEENRPDVVIVDVRMPPTFTDEGLVAARQLKARFPTLGVLVLSQYVEAVQATHLLGDDARGVGYVLKDRVADLETLTDAIRRVAAGGSVVDPEVVSRLLHRRRERDLLDDLTAREREVLGLIAEGHSNNAIGQRLTISLKTVETHIGTIFSKLELLPSTDDDRRVRAVLAYLRS